MPKPSAKTGAASKAAHPAPSPKSSPHAKKQYDFPLTTKRDVEQGTYTAERAEQLRQGNVPAVA